MKQRMPAFLVLMLLMAFSPVAFGAVVNSNTAQTAALHFFEFTSKYQGRAPLTAHLKYTRAEADGTVDFYVFDMSPVPGFVMISADDQVQPVIAYSLEAGFNPNTRGKGVQNWMTHAASHIYQGIRRHAMASAQISNQWSAYLQGQVPASRKSSASAVAPLTKTNWDQEPFYNQLCPYNSVDQQRTVTGCAATAMAQIMKFWNYPAQGTGSYAYLNAPPTCMFNYGLQSANFGATTYNWAAMPNKLDSNNLEVATLMYQCGVAVAMNYGDDNQGGSGAYVLNCETSGWRNTVQKAYVNYFSYNPNTLRGVQAKNFSSADWINLMKTELAAGRPIQYEGLDTLDGGHTWVCDGYDENDMLHMNWGWSGLDNGYYSVTALTAEGYNFSNNEAALIGIEPLSNLSVTASASSLSICPNGSAGLSATGPANANYTWVPSKGLSCPTCANTLASPDSTTTYTVTIDSAGLSATGSVTVVVNNLHVVSMQTNHVKCFGGNDGLAKVKVLGGNPAYAYVWNNGATTAYAANIKAGNYNVTVTDAAGCTVSAAAAITQPDSLVATITLLHANCSLADASLSMSVTGGTPAYNYAWANGAQDSVLFSPAAGAYTLTVSDAAGCSAFSSFNVTQPASLLVSIVTANTACSLLYGTATANVTGGSENFSFSWNTGENTPSISHLSAGTYSVTVSDALGCSSSDSVFFTQPDTLNVSIATSNTTDNKVYGKAVANVTGGLPQYLFSWNTGDTTSSISFANAGFYAVTITDSRGCAQTATTLVNETTGIESLNGNTPAFEVYPNPVSNNATIELSAAAGTNSIISVKNISGQQMYTSQVTSLTTQIDFSTYAPGIYLVTLAQGEYVQTRLVTKQ